MPYIKQEQRNVLDPAIGELQDRIHLYPTQERDGILNYIISTLVSDAIHPGIEPWRYADIARAVAVFECAKLEFYRRIAGPKEDVAIADNGDIDSYGKHENNSRIV